MKKSTLYAVLAVIVLAVLGLVGWMVLGQQDDQAVTSQQTTVSATPTVAKQGTSSATKAEEISYKGEAGKTALVLLQEHATVQTSGEGEMAFVTTINGYTAQKDEFWSFLVNGEMAPVGAGSYVTKDSDQITWKIEKISR